MIADCTTVGCNTPILQVIGATGANLSYDAHVLALSLISVCLSDQPPRFAGRIKWGDFCAHHSDVLGRTCRMQITNEIQSSESYTLTKFSNH